MREQCVSGKDVTDDGIEGRSFLCPNLKILVYTREMDRKIEYMHQRENEISSSRHQFFTKSFNY